MNVNRNYYDNYIIFNYIICLACRGKSFNISIKYDSRLSIVVFYKLKRKHFCVEGKNLIVCALEKCITRAVISPCCLEHFQSREIRVCTLVLVSGNQQEPAFV